MFQAKGTVDARLWIENMSGLFKEEQRGQKAEVKSRCGLFEVRAMDSPLREMRCLWGLLSTVT